MVIINDKDESLIFRPFIQPKISHITKYHFVIGFDELEWRTTTPTVKAACLSSYYHHGVSGCGVQFLPP